MLNVYSNNINNNYYLDGDLRYVNCSSALAKGYICNYYRQLGPRDVNALSIPRSGEKMSKRFSHSAYWLPTRKNYFIYTVANPARG